MAPDSAWEWDYPEPFEECPVCANCGNWFWLGMCGTHPRKKPSSLAIFKGQESSQSVSEGPGTREPETGAA